MNYLTKSPSETEKIGEMVAKKALKEKRAVFALKGNLGSGKTTFLKGFAKGLGAKEKILSPTFVIFRKMKIPLKRHFFHFDCYRIKNEKDLLGLGFKDIIKNEKNIIAIEWPEKIKKILPKDHVVIDFFFIDEKKRKISIK